MPKNDNNRIRKNKRQNCPIDMVQYHSRKSTSPPAPHLHSIQTGGGGVPRTPPRRWSRRIGAEGLKTTTHNSAWLPAAPTMVLNPIYIES